MSDKNRLNEPTLTPTRSFRRVITGLDDNGQSTIVSDGDCPVNAALWHEDFVVSDGWREDSLPADNSRLGETCFELSLEPSATGTLCRLVQFPPDSEYLDNVNAAEGFETLGSDGMESMTGHEESPHPLMHKSNTVDYIFIISGEIYAVMENGETLLHAGDMLIQRGTNHAWSNRSDQPCIMACVLNGAK